MGVEDVLLDLCGRGHMLDLEDADGAEAADVADVVGALEWHEAVTEVSFDGGGLRFPVTGLEEFERGAGGGAGEGVAHVGGAVHEGSGAA